MNKGHRIRASDKHLVYHFSIGTLLFVFVVVLLLLNMKQLMRTDWEHISLLENGLTLYPYNFITILIATGVCALVAFWYYRFCYDSFKKLLHRQKLARMILENKWYEADTVQDSGFFTDLQSRSREKIVWFPKIYYQMEKGLLHIRCEITLGKYQDQLLRLEDKLESGLYCELTDKTLHDGYIEYTMLYDMIANRITIDEVKVENGCLRLMKNLVWEYDALPHALIAGGTGGGKTYFLLTLIEALLHTNAILYILDPKNADLADLGTVMGNVYHTKEEMIDCVNAFYEGMVQRSEEMKQHPNYKTGENYAYLGLPPCFLIFDEYVAFFEMLGTKESVGLLSQLKKIVMLGRQAGYFLIVACQRPDAKYFSDGIRDNFNFRVGLGRISELGYGMLFGSDVKKQFFQKRIKGRGYCDVGTSVISEFYTPLVPKGHDFLQTIGSLAYARQDGTATCEAKGDGTDYPFFMVAFLQIVCFAGIYMKLGDIMSMFSLNANDSQSMGRRIFRRPYLFMRHRARRMEHRIARAVSAGGISGGVAGTVAGSAVAGKRAERKNTASKENRGNTSFSMGQRTGSKVGAVLDTKNKVKDKANAVKENIKDMPTQTAYAAYSAKEKAKSSVSDFKRGIVQEQQSRQTGRSDKLEQHRKSIADKRMELQKAQEARQERKNTDGSATKGATRPHERPATASTIPKPSVEKTQEIKRPATAPASKASEPVKTNAVKERPLSSGVSDGKTTQSAQPAHRQNVEKVVSQETRQNDTKDRRTKVQQTQTVQKNQQTTKKTRNLVTKKGQKKK
ncbi:TPA: FtsK/SpoIIIE domain-containing protein [Clostridioides difficile]